MLCTAVFQALNKLPEAQHGTDIMRVREPLLAGQGALYRQTILLSSFASAEINALMNRSCCNWAGQVKLKLTHQVCHWPGCCCMRCTAFSSSGAGHQVRFALVLRTSK